MQGHSRARHSEVWIETFDVLPDLGRRDAARWGSIVIDLGSMEVPRSAFNVADVIATGECLEGKSDMTFCEHMSAFDPKRTSMARFWRVITRPSRSQRALNCYGKGIGHDNRINYSSSRI